MKNIGFLTVRDKYPESYPDMTLVFHDVDTWPRWRGQLPYRTEPGVVAHYYGYEFALGGIVAIKAGDFERMGGFPNFWGWGIEDNVLYDRCVAAGMHIDRRVFFSTSSRALARPFDGYERLISKRDAAVYKYGSPDGLGDIRGLRRKLHSDTGLVDVLGFDVAMRPEEQEYGYHDIRQGTKLPVDPRYVPHHARRRVLVRRPPNPARSRNRHQGPQ